MQSPQSVVMVRPHFFTPNPQTFADNHFQKEANLAARETAKMAWHEVTEMANMLETKGIAVHLFEDETQITPDSVFPNNWLVTLPTGESIGFPMYAENRRAERRADIVDFLADHYRVCKHIDYAHFESQQMFLEGTGSMVLDHCNKVAYAALSNRTHTWLLQHFCHAHGYEAIAFTATDEDHVPVYHTNVMMSVGEEFAVIASEQIRDTTQRDKVLGTLKATGKEVIEITHEQVNHFCANVLQLRAKTDERYLAMSQTAFDNFTQAQKTALSHHARLLPFAVNTIELAGGSVRCMLAGIHLKNR